MVDESRFTENPLARAGVDAARDERPARATKAAEEAAKSPGLELAAGDTFEKKAKGFKNPLSAVSVATPPRGISGVDYGSLELPDFDEPGDIPTSWEEVENRVESTVEGIKGKFKLDLSKLPTAPDQVLGNIMNIIQKGSEAGLHQALDAALGGVAAPATLAHEAYTFSKIKLEQKKISTRLAAVENILKEHGPDKDLEALQQCLKFALGQQEKRSNRMGTHIIGTLTQLTGLAVTAGGVSAPAGAAVVVGGAGVKSSVSVFQGARSLWKSARGIKGDDRTQYTNTLWALARTNSEGRNPAARKIAESFLQVAGVEPEDSEKEGSAKLMEYLASSV